MEYRMVIDRTYAHNFVLTVFQTNDTAVITKATKT